MKPANFPDRKQARRLSALGRLKPTSAAYQNTAAKLELGSQRHVRTKKVTGVSRKTRAI